MNYKEIYIKSFGYSKEDFIPSEISGGEAVDIHHIHRKGFGGSKKLDRIENLMAVTRQEHIDFGDILEFKSWLYRIHKKQMILNNVEFDLEWINAQIKKYAQD